MFDRLYKNPLVVQWARARHSAGAGHWRTRLMWPAVFGIIVLFLFPPTGMVLVVLILALCPVVIATRTAVLASREIHSDTFKLVQVSSLSAEDIVFGLAYVLYRRSRVWLWLPSIGILGSGVWWIPAALYVSFSSSSLIVGNARSVAALALLIPVVVGLWDQSLLALMIGMIFGIHSRDSLLAGIFALLITLLSLVLMVTIFVVITFLLAIQSQVTLLSVSSLVALYPFALAYGLFRLSPRWV